MFSSLASFLFGSNTNCETNSKTTANTTAAAATGLIEELDSSLLNADNFIEVTSLTPSVTGAGGQGQQQRVIKCGKNRRNNARQQNKRKGFKNINGKQKSPLIATQTKLLTPSDNCDDEDFNEDEWFFVEKEDEEKDDSPSRADSEGENVSVIEVVQTDKPINAVAATPVAQQRRLQHINSHSQYSGPRPQKQRNYLQKTRNNTNNRSANGLSVSTLSPSRTVNDGRNAGIQKETADAIVTRSLYVSPTISAQQPSEEKKSAISCAANGLEQNNKMDDSCMSVHHSIKKTQETTEGFIKLEIGETVMAEEQNVKENIPKENPQAVQSRSAGSASRLDRQSVAQLKQELMARNVQKKQSKKERKDICRTAIKRANKVRDVQSRNHVQRRADRQHSKVFSNANNNRKSNCC